MYPIYVRKINSIKPNKIDNTNFIYIGRGNKYLEESLLHNPAPITKFTSRNRSLQIYRVWIWEAIKARHNEYRELLRLVELANQHPITLVCFCIDSDEATENEFIECHGQLIRKAMIYLDNLNKGNNNADQFVLA